MDNVVNFVPKKTLNDVQGYSLEETMQVVVERNPDLPAEAIDKSETDLTIPISPAIRRALVGRYPLCVALWDDFKNGKGERRTDIDFKGIDRCVAAAAIALRPSQLWEWKLVEAWSQVYLHAVLVNISIDEFENWCEFHDPNISQDMLMNHLDCSDGSLRLTDAGDGSVTGAAGDDA